jgi:hypothetical protein
MEGIPIDDGAVDCVHCTYFWGQERTGGSISITVISEKQLLPDAICFTLICTTSSTWAQVIVLLGNTCPAAFQVVSSNAPGQSDAAVGDTNETGIVN